MIQRSVDVFAIYDEIGCLEGASFTRRTNTKPQSQFQHKPLGGLWHKHYSQAGFIGKNLGNYWKPKRLDRYLKSILKVGDILDQPTLGRLIHEVVIGDYEKRSNAQEITGEWIVYARHLDVNYYLTLGVHGDDHAIAERARACADEFPELDILRT